MAQPLSPSYPSTHQPSRMEQVQAAVDGHLHAARARRLRAGGGGCSATRPRRAPCSGRRSCRSLRGTRPGGGTRPCGPCWTTRAMSSLPPLSFGCALPAKMNCTGRSVAFRMAVSRAGSRKIRSPRLYVANRRAKPMVRASGSSTSSARTTSAGGAPRRLQLRLEPGPGEGHEPLPARRSWVRHSSASGIASIALPHGEVGRLRLPLHARGSGRTVGPLSGGQPALRVDAVGDRLVMGTSAGGSCRPDVLPHLRRDTVPCSLLTPLRGVRQLEGQDGHAERLGLVGRVLPAQRE